LAVAVAIELRSIFDGEVRFVDLSPFDDAFVFRTLTAFGIALCVPRGRQAPEPPETIAGTLAYMAPEQIGRIDRSIDSRSDLYALGVTFYQMHIRISKNFMLYRAPYLAIASTTQASKQKAPASGWN
jgi:serine/threonine protein kinase